MGDAKLYDIYYRRYTWRFSERGSLSANADSSAMLSTVFVNKKVQRMALKKCSTGTNTINA